MPDTKPSRSVADKLTLWIGIIGSVITITLTIWNTHTRQKIDEREEQLKTLEFNLKEGISRDGYFNQNAYLNPPY